VLREVREGNVSDGKLTLIGIIKRSVAGGLITAFLISAPVTRAIAGSELAFPTPSAIEPNVNFWVQVFTNYSERDFVVHDRDQVDHVYQVLHLPGDGDPTREEIDGMNDFLKSKYSDILNRLASGQTPATDDERRVADMFKGQPLSAYAAAAQNLRVQEGLRERFREGLLRSKYYRPTMERIFRGAGLPPELVTLATVESGFYSRAKSSAVVASGAMTRSTEEWEISRSCHNATFSSAGMTVERISRARPVRFSASTGLRLCGIAEEPFCPEAKYSSTSRNSLRCRWRISVASRSMPAAINARVMKYCA